MRAARRRWRRPGTLCVYRLCHLSPRSQRLRRRPNAISVLISGMPEPPPLRQCRARLVDRRVVWSGFAVRPENGLMLFNSYQFIFLFLPIALIGYFALGRFGNLAPVIWLALASLAFYSVSNWQFVLLLLASVAFNYVIGLALISQRPRAV